MIFLCCNTLLPLAVFLNMILLQHALSASVLFPSSERSEVQYVASYLKISPFANLPSMAWLGPYHEAFVTYVAAKSSSKEGLGRVNNVR